MLGVYRVILPHIKHYGRWYLIGALCLAVTDAGQLFIPQILEQVIDILDSTVPDRGRISTYVLTMIMIALVVAAGRFGWRFFLHGASRRIEVRLRIRLFNHLLRLSGDFYSRKKTGDLMARATNDLQAVRMATSMGLVAFMDGVFMSIAILIIMLFKEPKVALLAAFPLPTLTVLVLFFGKRIGKLFQRVQEGFSGLSGFSQEALTGIRVLKSYGAEERAAQQFAEHNEIYQSRNMRLVRIWGMLFPFITFLSGITSLMLLRFGGEAVARSSMTPGEFVAMLSYLQMLIWPMIGAGFVVNSLQRGAASLRRIKEILDTEPTIRDKPQARICKRIGTLRIQNLRFRYGEDFPPAVQINDLEIPEGSLFGIVGRTGSGKTTLLNLIIRSLDTPADTVFAEGADITGFRLRSYRSRYAVVPQDTFLFSESIADNIRFGKGEADPAALSRVVEAASLSADLADLPDGLETVVGERGITLSGGQKQRVAIARALLADPEVLILDDALSAVDSETEERILNSVLESRKGRTTIFVSQRITTLSRADRITVLENGQLSGIGKHCEMLERNRLYKDLYTLQLHRAPDQEGCDG